MYCYEFCQTLKFIIAFHRFKITCMNEIANFLTGKGYGSIYLPRDAYGDIRILIENPFAFFSHKHAAYLAGMGSFGHNNVILTPQYGPRVRFTSIFTTAEIPPDPIKIKDLCIKCLRCVKNCPVGAIPLKGEFPPPVDKKFERYHKAWEHVRKYGSK